VQEASLPQGRATGYNANGGLIYANKGMFIPRGTDTVPAMLTPGEFVVNRAAVNRGNNLQLLKAMNGGGNTGGNNSQAAGMAAGGQVGYYQFGGMVDTLGAIFSEAGSSLTSVFSGFTSAVEKLQDMQISIKLDPTNVNVNFNGTSFLATLKEDVKNDLLEVVRNELGNSKIGQDGIMRSQQSMMPT
jgi:hypothetical protein